MGKATQTFVRILKEDAIFLPVSLVIVLAGGVMWLTNLAFKVDATAIAFSTLEIEQKKRDAELNQKFERIMEDLGFIRGKMEGIDARKNTGNRYLSN
jgi:hypothetical protein